MLDLSNVTLVSIDSAADHLSKNNIRLAAMSRVFRKIIENINFSFPPFILKKIRDKYAEKKTLPLFINGIKKLDKYRYDNGIISPKIIYQDNKNDIDKLIKNDE